MSKITESKINISYTPIKFLQSPSSVVSFPRTTYFNFSVLYLQIANRNTHGIRLSKKGTFLHFFIRDKEVDIKPCFHFFILFQMELIFIFRLSLRQQLHLIEFVMRFEITWNNTNVCDKIQSHKILF